jgi:hypothetical protein
MVRIVINILEGLIQYTLLGVIIALFAMLILLILLYARNKVSAYLNIAFISNKFDELCELSDRLDEDHVAQGPLGGAVWLYRLILRGLIAVGGLMILWIALIALKA